MTESTLPPSEPVHLTGASAIRVGEFERGKAPAGPALLESREDQDLVVMLGDSKAGSAGTLESWQDVREVLLGLEARQRAGVITFTLRTDTIETIEATLSCGSLGLAEDDGCAFLRELRAAEPLSYRYTPELRLGASLSHSSPPSRLLKLIEPRYSQRRRGRRVD